MNDLISRQAAIDEEDTKCLKGLPGGTGETVEEVLLQGPATGVSDSHLLGDSTQCSQLGGPGSQDPAQLGPGDG